MSFLGTLPGALESVRVAGDKVVAAVSDELELELDDDDELDELLRCRRCWDTDVMAASAAVAAFPASPAPFAPLPTPFVLTSGATCAALETPATLLDVDGALLEMVEALPATLLDVDGTLEAFVTTVVAATASHTLFCVDGASLVASLVASLAALLGAVAPSLAMLE